MWKSHGATIVSMRSRRSVHAIVLVPDGPRDTHNKFLQNGTTSQNASEVDKLRSNFVCAFREFEAMQPAVGNRQERREVGPVEMHAMQSQLTQPRQVITPCAVKQRSEWPL